jgi:E-phenylitaconyl-CoA hydratase
MLLNRGLEVWKPVIAAINGHCLAGGMTLMLATDLRVTAEHATFALSEVKRGIIPANGGTQRLPAQLPHAIAMEMLLIGDAIDAQTAARWGLVNRVVPTDKVMETALELARRIAANAPLAVQAIKELALRSQSTAWPPVCARAVRAESAAVHRRRCRRSPGLADKRPPRFKEAEMSLSGRP